VSARLLLVGAGCIQSRCALTLVLIYRVHLEPLCDVVCTSEGILTGAWRMRLIMGYYVGLAHCQPG
jgi:hypothetical protein